MIFYIALFSFVIIQYFLCEKLNEKQKKMVEIFTLLVLIIVSGTRYHLGGSDYSVYYITYNSVPKLNEYLSNYSMLDIYYRTFGFERGYLFYNSLIKTLGFNFYGFTLINSTIFYSVFYFSLYKYTKKWSLIIIVFMYKLFFYNTFISMRQPIAIIIFLFSIRFIFERKFLKYFLCILIASRFHLSSIILLPVYFVNAIEINKKRLIIVNIIFIPTILIGYFNIPILKHFDFLIEFMINDVTVGKAENLIYGTPTSAISFLHTIEFFLLMFFVIRFYDNIVNKNNGEKIIKLFIVLLPLFTLFRHYEILTRLKDYFIITYPILIAYILDIKKFRYKRLFLLGVILLCAFGFFRFIVLFDNGHLVPYKSYIFENVSIFFN